MLSEFIKTRGLKPSIISRGYCGNSSSYPVTVDYDSEVEEVGDETLLLREKTDCPVVVNPDLALAKSCLLEIYDCDVVISDDGLQHYALVRDMEIAKVDDQRLFSNGFCPPVGPLREPVSSLQSVDHVVLGYLFSPDAGGIVKIPDK